MNNLKSAFDKIKADDILKEKTKNYVRNNMQKEKTNVYVRSSRIMRKYLVAAVFAVVILGGSITGYAYYKTPTSYVSLDINPSVELGVNAFGRVVTVKSVNEDGQTIVDDTDVINNNVEDAVDELVQSAIDNNYVNEDGSSVISVTAESNDPDKAEDIQDDSEKGALRAINFKKYAASIYKDCSDLSLRTEAKNLGISPGKYKLIKMLQSLDPTITVEQYKDAKVSEIMAKAREIVANMTDEQLKDAKIKVFKEKMQNVAERIKENKEKAKEIRQKVKEKVSEKISEKRQEQSSKQSSRKESILNKQSSKRAEQSSKKAARTTGVNATTATTAA